MPRTAALQPSPESVRFGKCEIKILDKVAGAATQAEAEAAEMRSTINEMEMETFLFSPVAAFEIYFCVIDIAACFEYSQCCYLAPSTLPALPALFLSFSPWARK